MTATLFEGESYTISAEQFRSHLAQVSRQGSKIHVGQHVLLHVDSRRHFDQLQSVRPQPKHGPLGHIENLPTRLPGVGAAEADLIDAADVLVFGALPAYSQAAVRNVEFGAGGGEQAAEHDFPGALGNVDEAAHSGHAIAESTRLLEALAFLQPRSASPTADEPPR